MLLVIIVLAIVAHIVLATADIGTMDWVLVLPHLLILVAALVSDYRRFRTVITPMAVFAGIYLIVVILPILVNDDISNQNWLNSARLVRGSFVYLLFLSACCLAYRMFPSERKEPISSIRAIPGFERSTEFYQLALAISMILLVLNIASLVKVGGLNIAIFLVDPITKISARWSGANWSAIFKGAASISFTVLLFTKLGVDLSRKSVAIGLGLYFIQTLLSGSKSGFFLPLAVLLMTHGFITRKIRVSGLVLALIIALFLVPVTFAWRGAFENPNSSISQRLLSYNHIFYFTARASYELEPDVQHFAQGLSDLLITPIPRILWSAKPLEYGLTRRLLDYWLVSSNLPIERSFNTMGLAEIWIALGYFGIIISGLILGCLLAISTASLRKPKSLGRFVYGIFIIGSIYPILRVGFLNTYIYNMAATFLAAVMMDNVARYLFNRKRTQSEIHSHRTYLAGSLRLPKRVDP